VEERAVSVAPNWLLALATLATAALALLARRDRVACAGRALNTLCLAALCLRLEAPIVAGALALLGVSALLTLPVDPAPSAPRPTPQRIRLLSVLLLIAGGGLLAFALGSILFVGHAPGQVALEASATTPAAATAARQASSLFAEHGLPVLAVGLIILTVAVSLRRQREAR
jgi:hypothetical protein